MATEELDLEKMTLDQLRQKLIAVEVESELSADEVVSREASGSEDYWVQDLRRLIALKDALRREIAKREGKGGAMPDKQPLEHECPYQATVEHSQRFWLCGYSGLLCHRCREDRADARAQKIAEANIELVGNFAEEIALNRAMLDRVSEELEAIRKERSDDA